jgi:hypothetical protein
LITAFRFPTISISIFKVHPKNSAKLQAKTLGWTLNIEMLIVGNLKAVIKANQKVWIVNQVQFALKLTIYWKKERVVIMPNTKGKRKI